MQNILVSNNAIPGEKHVSCVVSSLPQRRGRLAKEPVDRVLRSSSRPWYLRFSHSVIASDTHSWEVVFLGGVLGRAPARRSATPPAGRPRRGELPQIAARSVRRCAADIPGAGQAFAARPSPSAAFARSTVYRPSPSPLPGLPARAALHRRSPRERALPRARVERCDARVLRGSTGAGPPRALLDLDRRAHPRVDAALHSDRAAGLDRAIGAGSYRDPPARGDIDVGRVGAGDALGGHSGISAWARGPDLAVDAGQQE